MTASKLCVSWFLLVLASTATFGAPKPVFHFVQCPGASQTWLRGINNHNVLVGSCTGSDHFFHGFMRDAHGVTWIDHPNGARGTILNDINDDGVIVGFYLDELDSYHAFVYVDGVFSDIGPPGAMQSSANGSDNLGRVAGGWTDANGEGAGWIFDGTSYLTFARPVFDINIHDAFVEIWEPFQNFVRSAICTKSGCSTIHIPGAVSVHATGIDSSGNVVLTWTDIDNNYHGGILVGQRTVKFDAPGCYATSAFRMNDKHVVVGSCWAGQTELGYYATLAGK